MTQSKSGSAIADGILGEVFTERFTNRTRHLFNDSDELVKLSQKWSNVAKDKVQGHMFEQLEVTKFNYDALKKDSELYAKTTASMGLPTDPVDIVIKRGNKTVREIQAKSCGTAARSTFSLSQQKYAEMARLAPKDQTEKIKGLLNKRIESGTLKADDYKQTLRNLQDSLNQDNIKSSGTTYQESVKSTDKKTAIKISNQYKSKAALTDMHESGIRSGMVGAGISGAVSAVDGTYELYKGEVEIGEAVSNIVVDSVKGFATGYTVTALSKGLTHTTSHFLGQSISKAFTRSTAPVAIAAGIVTSSKSIISYLNGDISSDELLSEINHTAITCTSAFYYGALGQVAIPIPVVGVMVGAGIGYFIGNMLHQSSLIALGDSRIVKEAKEKRKMIEAMCLSSIPIMRKNRMELEEILYKYFLERKNEFEHSFKLIDDSLSNFDPDSFVTGLEKINQSFGAGLQFNSFSEFDDFMQKENENFSF